MDSSLHKDIAYEELNGLITKKKIVEAAKGFFCLYGYTKSTIKMITEKVGISIGSLAYHFKKKEDIVSYIMFQYINKFYDEITALSTKKLTAFELHTYASIPYYINLFCDGQTRAFYHELLLYGAPHLQSVSSSSISSFDKQMFETFMEGVNPAGESINQLQTSLTHQFCRAGRSHLIQAYLEGHYPGAPEIEVINQASRILGLCMLYELDYVNEVIADAEAFYAKHPFEDIQLLK
ncbi:MAG: TetR/AcrR family transcriptional regulator [Eubacteriaceae bacterium]|nr:TetR/AcrR family transcriptional regulator [Eubacteriaceae bacterium]